MAHYKRGKARINCFRAMRGSEASWRKENGLTPIRLNRKIWRDEYPEVSWASLWHPWKSRMRSHPKWWDIAFHTRPKRRKTRALEKKVLQGADPDNLVWPLSNHKPHNYYW